MRNSFIHELELENDRGAVETSFVFFIACFYNKMSCIFVQYFKIHVTAMNDTNEYFFFLMFIRKILTFDSSR